MQRNKQSSLIKAEKGKYYPEVYLYGDYSLYEDDSPGKWNETWLVGRYWGGECAAADTSGRSDKVAAARAPYLKFNSLSRKPNET